MISESKKFTAKKAEENLIEFTLFYANAFLGVIFPICLYGFWILKSASFRVFDTHIQHLTKYSGILRNFWNFHINLHKMALNNKKTFLST
jgi:hypothetical protein